ncbi:MAG: winged helix-turn-helix domain-containing protein [Candidatus Micrarchaeia archaeon]|jgi:hypothetical protein
MAIKVEEYFGIKAGAVWTSLSSKGPQNIAQLKRTTRLSDSELYAALGWLARESKIEIIGERPLFFKFKVTGA